MRNAKFAVAIGMTLFAMAFSASAASAESILINFTSDHCGPCRAMKPILQQLERSGIPVRHVDVAREHELVRRYGIRSTPTFVVVSGGKEVTRLVGSQSLTQLRSAIAINPQGPLIQTGAKSRPSAPTALDSIAPPQTRLAPVAGSPTPQTLTSKAPLAPAAGEAMPSISLADSVEKAKSATVRLRVHDGHGYGVGTGTIIDTHGAEALVLTCGHLFRDTQGQGKIEVDLFIGAETKTVEGKVVDYDADTRDIALVVIRPGFPVQSVKVLPSTEKVINGQTAFSFGCDRGDDPSRRDTRITGINKYNQHLGVSNLEIAGAPIDGRSGGGLFDAEGRLIGVCNSADYKGDVGIYAGPGSVNWQLDRVDLAHLYQGQGSPAAAPVDRIASVPSAPAAAPATAAVVPASLSAPVNAAPITQPSAASSQEVIVIVRDRNQPESTSRVMTLNNPSADLLNMIQQQAR